MRAPDHQRDQLDSQPATATLLRVLLVEDSEDDAALLARYFERAGYRPAVRRVETADEMRRALSEPHAQWDVVLSDFNLPNFSAPAALKLLKHLGQDVPFIIMSGAVSEETAVEAMRAGAHDYVSKQNLARLLPAIEREMREARARRLKDRTPSTPCFSARSVSAASSRRCRLALWSPMPKGLIQYANTNVEHLLGYGEQELHSGAYTFGRYL